MNYNDNNIAALFGENCFAMYDAALYLDTHPNDQNALEFFRRKQQKHQMLLQEYNKTVGPLTANDTDTSCGSWNWVDEPWPWQL